VYTLEPGIKPEPNLVTDMAAAMRDFMAFHHAQDLFIARSEPEVFGKELLAAI
jgi:hypothetical protein